jgi:hypothetical protein
MRFSALLAVLLLAACEGSFVRPGDVGRTARVERTYEARDACLARNAGADGVSTTDAATLAHAAAMACASETEKLVEAVNPNGDSKVAAAVRKDSEFRAMKYVLQARGQAIFQE